MVLSNSIYDTKVKFVEGRRTSGRNTKCEDDNFSRTNGNLSECAIVAKARRRWISMATNINCRNDN